MNIKFSRFITLFQEVTCFIQKIIQNQLINFLFYQLILDYFIVIVKLSTVYVIVKPVERLYFIEVQYSTSSFCKEKNSAFALLLIPVYIPCTFKTTYSQNQYHHPNLSLLWLCPRPISNSQLHVLPHFHLCPIYLVVFKGSY